MDFRPVFLIIGLLLATLALVMLAPVVVDAIDGNPEWEMFAICASVTLFVGVAMTLASRADRPRLSIRQAFVMTTATWLVLTFFSALPFMFSELRLSFTDAFFEAMSGITTTGSTVIVGLDMVPRGLLLWRALLQWLGGIGIIVMGIAILPMLRVGGMQLFRMESSDRSEKALPRAAEIASAIVIIYLALSMACATAYWIAGMGSFDAVTHAMTTLATGGFSSYDDSIGHFKSAAVEVIAMIFMVLGSLPLLLYLHTLRGRPRAIIEDSQVRWYATIIVAAVLVAAGWLWLADAVDPLTSLRMAAFNIISVITTTGYVTSDFSHWGSFTVPMFFFVMFIGGCAGSTAGGIKIFRLQVLYAAGRTQLYRLLQPHGVFTPRFDRRPIADEVIISVLSFFFIWFFTFAVVSLGLAVVGLDFLTSMTSAATAIANVGPALGSLAGPAGTFQPLPDAAKWMLAAGMLLGRLELFTVIVLFSRPFWRD